MTNKMKDFFKSVNYKTNELPELDKMSKKFQELGAYVIRVRTSKKWELDKFRISQEFGFNISTKWGSLYDQFTGAFPAISDIIKSAKSVLDMGNMITTATENKVLDSTILSARVFQKSDPLVLTFTFDLFAYEDANREVIKPVVDFISLCLPESGSAVFGDTDYGNVASFFRLPGPSVGDIVRLNTGGNANFTGNVITLQVANYFFAQGLILTQVNPTFTNKLDKNGKPMMGKVQVTFETAWTPTAQQVRDMFLVPRDYVTETK